MPKYIVVLEVQSTSDPELWDWNYFGTSVDIEVVCTKEMK